MRLISGCYALAVLSLSILPIGPAAAAPFFFSTGDTDARMALASRTGAGGTFGIEAADDFVLTGGTTITGASFTGLITGDFLSIAQVQIEFFRVFPQDSDVGRTSGPPTFSTTQVPTRVNSPGDAPFDSRDAGSGGLNFSITSLTDNFSADNSVRPGGIHPAPGQTTGGNGPVTGTEVRFDVTFTTPLVLPGDHYFFVPQVDLTDGDFFWLSAPRPIAAGFGTPFPAGATDLQTWVRDDFLDPDWLRVGTDIVGVGAFNGVFSLTGESTPVPEPASLALFLAAVAGLALRRRL